MIKHGLKITRERALKILKKWQMGRHPHRRVISVFRGEWYDIRGLQDPVEVDQFLEYLAGKKITKENTMDIKIS